MKKIAIQENSATAWQRYKQARNEVNNAIKSAKKQYFTHNLEVNKLNPRKTWKLIDDLTSRKNGRVRNISEIKVNNESISSAVEMAEVFNDFFATIGSYLASEIQPSTIGLEFYLQPTDTIFSLKPPSTSTVCRLLNQLDTNKATGLDRIPCKLLKLSSSIVGPSLAYIFKCCIDAEIFPNEWKIAKVTPLFKKESKRELGNYRPISVLPLVSKIFEKIIYCQLYDYLQDNSLLNTYQSGFRSMHSTLTALLETTNNWSINIDNGVLFIDLKKAFDTIDHEIILRKLANYGVNQSALRFCGSHLCNRSQKCSVNEALSSASKLTYGVPQGSILGPLLFLIYINDLPNCLDISCAKMFADDTNITVPGCTFAQLEQATNSELNNLYNWLKANKLSLNIAKTEFMVISTRQKFLAGNCSKINIQLDGHPISRVEHTKSLGLNIDDRLSWSNHIKDLCKKISSVIGALRRIRPLISQSTAVQIYNALIQPHFDYCAPVWDGLSSYLCEKLQKLQNRAARVILQANCEINSSLLLETLKWDKLSSRRRKQKAIMMFKSLNGLAPEYLQDLFSERNTDYNLRDAFRKLNLPKPRTDYLKRSFGYSGALLWNSPPENIRAIRSIGQFKKEINCALKTTIPTRQSCKSVFIVILTFTNHCN